MKMLGLSAVVLAAAIATPAFAQLPPCARQEPTPGRAVSSDPQAVGSMTGAILLGAGFPEDDGKSLKGEAKCAFGEAITVGSVSYTVTDSDDIMVARRIVSTTPNAPAFYLSRMLAGLAGGRPQLGLVSITPGGLGAWVIYDGLPSNQVLQQDITNIVAGRMSPMVMRKAGTKNIEITMPGKEEEPPEPWQGKRADGKVFVSERRGGVRHVLTGFICPERVGAFPRTDLMSFDGKTGGHDVACRYGATRNTETWFTFYLTELPDETHADIFALYVRNAKEASGAGVTLASPVPVGPSPAPTSAEFWEGRSGASEGLTLSSIGPWRVKMRVTMRPGDDAKVAEAAAALYQAAYEQVKP